MIILLAFAFLAGVVTILSPCILPILPIVLSGSVVGGRRRPFGVVTGFILSFTFFTLFLTSIVNALGVSANVVRNISVVVVFLFGLALLLPKFQEMTELLFAKLSKFTPKSQNKGGFLGGTLVGFSIGLVWTPCVGPILASVISLALTGSVTGTAFLITFAYALGTAIPMLAIVYGGRGLLNKVPWLVRNTGGIQKAFGVFMILTALAIYFNFDRQFQAYILKKFPQYGAGLTSLEDNEKVKKQLEDLKGGDNSIYGSPTWRVSDPEGKPMNEILDDTEVRAPELIPGGKWFNVSNTPLQHLPVKANEGEAIRSLRGKVVIVDFWTYTCINCIRTLPYLDDWYEKYSDKGLVIIGVHTPEFEFEKSPENVEKAINDFGLKYAVMQDNDYATWRAYANRYWPAKYLIDKDGKIRYTHFGEGKYDETEEVIQALLAETGSKVNEKIDNPEYQVETKTPELYLGYGRMGFFATPGQLEKNTKALYKLPEEIALHHFALNGDWEIGEERSMPYEGSTLVLAFEAKDVYIVMRPTSDKGMLKVYLDDKLVKEGAGEDVVDGVVIVDKDRLYKLIKLEKAGQHVLKLEFLDANTELYAFTFG
jgi:cytochrome c biogenesis protein CcdA/thiol-disulfide isomerase/thioredoxin